MFSTKNYRELTVVKFKDSASEQLRLRGISVTRANELTAYVAFERGEQAYIMFVQDSVLKTKGPASLKPYASMKIHSSHLRFTTVIVMPHISFKATLEQASREINELFARGTSSVFIDTAYESKTPQQIKYEQLIWVQKWK